MKLYSNVFLFVAIIFSIINQNLSSENFSVIFPFKTIDKNEPELTTSFNTTITNEIMKNIFLNELFIELEIGSPPQKLNIRISVNSDDFFISEGNATFEKKYPKKDGNFYYNKSISTTFQFQQDKKKYIYSSHTHESQYTMDNINFHLTNKKTNKINFEFWLARRVGGPNHGIIGLKHYPYTERRQGFYSLLKKHDLIKNKIWYLEFDNKNKNGNLIIGNYPHFDNNIIKTGKKKFFDLNHFEKIYSIIKKERWDSNWGLNFSKIYLQNATTSICNEILNNTESFKNAVLNPNLGVIIGFYQFKFLFERIYLNKFLDNNICFQPMLKITRNYEDNYYYYYYCKASYIDQMKKEFNPIIFEHKEFNYNFSLEFDDLFIRKKDYIYLRIIFDQYISNWIFGSPFFSKYSLFFDSDSKEIGFYSPNINHNILGENYDKNNDKGGNSATKVILQIFLGIILVILGIYLGKKLFGLKRKLRANELEEKFEYKPEEKQIQMY